MLEWDGEGNPDGYTGFLGYCSDEEDLLLLEPELRPVRDFDWHRYRAVADYEPRDLTIVWREASEVVRFEPEEPLPDFLDKLTSVQAYIIRSDDDAGPGSGTGYAFFIADDVSRDEVRASVLALREALDADLKRLSGS